MPIDSHELKRLLASLSLRKALPVTEVYLSKKTSNHFSVDPLYRHRLFKMYFSIVIAFQLSSNSETFKSRFYRLLTWSYDILHDPQLPLHGFFSHNKLDHQCNRRFLYTTTSSKSVVLKLPGCKLSLRQINFFSPRTTISCKDRTGQKLWLIRF